jgi:hypothetical protein
MFKLVTKILIACTAATLIVYDIFVAVEDTPGDTISEVMLGWAYKLPLLPYAFGVLCGHLFWPTKRIPEYRIYEVVGLATSGLLLLVLSLVGIYPTTITPALPMVVGVFAGHFLWSQKIKTPL